MTESTVPREGEHGTIPPWSTGVPLPPHEARPESVLRNPAYFAFLMGPAALVALLLLMRFHLIVREPVWLWIAVFVAIPLSSLLVVHLYDKSPTPLRLDVRIAVQAAAVTTVIYLSGWGPVLSAAFAFLALENIARVGSRVWPVSTFWSLTGIAVGQVAISQGWAPSELSTSQANALALMGAFILVFIIRMAGATMEQTEKAESAMRVSEDRFRSLIQNSTDTTLVVDDDGIYVYVSPSVTQILGFEPNEMVGRPSIGFVHPDDRRRMRSQLEAQFHSPTERVIVQFRMAKADGGWCHVEAVITNQRDRPSVAGFVANVRDITERKEFEALLAHRALHDPLTGLANRQLILDRAEQMLIRSRRLTTPVAAYFIDLDNFKDANDSLGHEAGDKLLQAVAGRFSGLLRASDTVGRMGGDEFVILTEGTSLTTGPTVVAERIREVLRTPFYVEGYADVPITVSASIGIATGDRLSAQELLRDADIALYRAKASGRDCCVMFEHAMQAATVDRLELKSDLDSALANGEYFLLYQPIFDLEHSHIRGVEALLRWQHPARGVIAPDEFIPILEDNGMIVDVGRWALGEACAQLARWRSQGHRISMSVNVSMRQLETEGLVMDVREAISANALEPASLTIEVTESTLMRDANATVSRLGRLKELGVMIAIDDFGTGYSSMAYLRQFPVDVLKIDRSFIAEMDGSPNSAALIHMLVELGRILGLETLAEGIEDSAQLDALRSEKCDSGQGFYFSRPVAPAAVEALLIRSADHPAPPPTLTVGS